MSTSDESNPLEQRAALIAEIAAIGDFRPGSLQSRYRRCGRPGCHCAREGDPGHGPKWVLTRTVEGRRRNFSVPDGAVEATRAQVGEYRRFRELVRELVEVSERCCEAGLGSERDPARPGKGGRSNPRSRRRSDPSSGG